MYYRLFKSFYGMAAKRMCQDCENFIQKDSKILDLGCGSGIVGKAFQDFFKAKIIGVDIRDFRVENIPFQIFDGKKLPFSDNSFDIILINYVLHHSGNPVALLKEAKRMTKGKIIVFEDLSEGFLSKLICKIHGITFDRFFGNPTKTSFNTELPKEAKVKMRTKFSFASEKGWEKIFKELELNIIFKKRVNNFPVKKELFICRA